MNTKVSRKGFSIRLANKIIHIEPIYDYVREICKDYITEELAEIVIRTDDSDLVYEYEKSVKEDRNVGIPIRVFPKEYLETLAVYRKIVDRLVDDDILLFHGSAVAVDGQGYLFVAKSGTGKSTHTKYWREIFGERAVMINDDKPLITVDGNKVAVHGTPWMGKHNLGTNTSVPLKAICFLERAEENYIERLTSEKIYGVLIQYVYRPKETEAMEKVLAILEQIVEYVKFYRLECNKKPESARIAYNGMNGGLQ